MMQTRVQVYYGKHATSSYENRTIAEHQYDLICTTEKMFEKSMQPTFSTSRYP
jgi:hypothetical protein